LRTRFFCLKSIAMKLIVCHWIFLGFICLSRSQDDNDNVRRIMKEMEVTPDILEEPPRELLRVSNTSI